MKCIGTVPVEPITSESHSELYSAYDAWCSANGIHNPPKLWVNPPNYRIFRVTSARAVGINQGHRAVILSGLSFANNDSYSTMEQLSVIAHEVAHILIRDIDNFKRVDAEEERQADQFAVETTKSHILADALEKFYPEREERLESESISKNKEEKAASKMERGKLSNKNNIYGSSTKRLERIRGMDLDNRSFSEGLIAKSNECQSQYAALLEEKGVGRRR